MKPKQWWIGESVLAAHPMSTHDPNLAYVCVIEKSAYDQLKKQLTTLTIAVEHYAEAGLIENFVSDGECLSNAVDEAKKLLLVGGS